MVMWHRRTTQIVVMLLVAPIIAYVVVSAWPAQKHVPTDELERTNGLYSEYLKGNVGHARECLLEAVHIIEGATCNDERVRAHGLYMGYGRLHMLELRCGNGAMAEAYWAKTRYWLLRKVEIDRGLSLAGEVILKSTPETNISILDEWDRRRTNGRGPEYLGHLDPHKGAPDNNLK